jgi:pimeloyl-ACP methyl ester carboxylesterase
MKKSLQLFLLASLFVITSVAKVSAQENFELIKYKTQDGGEIQAAHFKTEESNKVVIFAHGAIFNKESWYFLAKKFQQNGVSSLSIDFRGYGESKGGETNQKYYDILGAIEYLKGKGFKEIDLIGGSMGGAATLMALSNTADPIISKVLLLSPAGGPAIEAASINKYFIVSKEEGLYDRVKSIYTESADPKVLKEYEGSAHAQHMFKEKYADDLTQLILDFIIH